MWNFKKQDANCSRILEQLEEFSVTGSREVTPESLLDTLSSELRNHSLDCVACRTALDDFAMVRRLTAKLPSYASAEAPWFSKRVMAAIAAREYELSQPLSISAILPKLAARLSWVTSAVLLLASTFLFQRPVSPPPAQPATTAQDSLFETTQIPTGRDEILLSLAERKP